MSIPILATKLYIPPLRPGAVVRPRLIEQLNVGLQRKVTLVSAPAGFGKTTLVAEWAVGCHHPVAWLSLDDGDSDYTRFLTYLVATLQTIAPTVGQGVVGVLQSTQPPPTESTLTALLNDITTIPEDFVLVLDDYSVVDSKSVDHALTFIVEHLPAQMHLVIVTREDPQLPMARLRARGQLIELRVADLRFTPSEAAGFLNQVMGLNLSAKDVAALERRTEGWIAGLQLAAISLRGHPDATNFIQSFTGSHQFVLDYLAEEVLHRQSERVRAFLLRTSILDRLCGPLCDTVLEAATGSGQATLEYLEHANLFLVPLDNERRWYRYHQLFADLLRQRLHQNIALPPGNEGLESEELHRRASSWYETNGLEIEAFRHATAANDVERAERLIEGNGMPLYFRGAGALILNWLASQPTSVLDASPGLWVAYVTALTFAGTPTEVVEQKLHAAELALNSEEPGGRNGNLVGHIAALRAMLAIPRHQVDAIIAQSRRALEYLHPNNLPVRTGVMWTLGFGYQLQGDRTAAIHAYADAIAVSQASGNVMITLAATTCLGQVQESENQLYLAEESYRFGVKLAGDPPMSAACEAFVGLARVLYEWNDLDASELYGQQCLQLASQMVNVDTPVSGWLALARLRLARGDVSGAAAIVARAEQFVLGRNFIHRMPEVAAAQVLLMVRQGNLVTAAQLAQTHDLPISLARVHLARGDPAAAIAALEPWRRQVEATGWGDERLKVMVLQAVALQAYGDSDRAVGVLVGALMLAQPGGFIRLFVDEGAPMARLLSMTAGRGSMSDYVGKLLAVSNTEMRNDDDSLSPPSTQLLVEPLSHRELEVLHLLMHGLSNHEIGERLVLALDTVKGHNRKIYGKLQVQRRTEAVARARELGLL